MEKDRYDIVAAVHRLYIDGKRKKGGADKILEYFSKKGKSILLIEHPLCGLREGGKNADNWAIISKIESGEIIELERKEILKKGNIIRWISEVFFNLIVIHTKIKGRPVYFSADPLNNLAALFSLGKLKYKYYHSVDYSRDRFGVLNLNIVYQLAIFLSLKRFNLISVVSDRTRREFIKMGGDPNKIILLPNSPDYKNVNIPDKNNYNLIYTSNAIIKRYNYEFVIDLISLIKKEIPKIKLYALGGKNVDSSYFEKIVKLVKKYRIKRNIVFPGFVDEKKLSGLFLNSRIGLSFYSGIVSYYMIFGDSLKIREYALWGLPIISDGNSATDEEMAEKGCGFIAKDLNQAKERIVGLLKDKRFYNQCSQNSLKWAKAMDKKVLLEKIYKKLYSYEGK